MNAYGRLIGLTMLGLAVYGSVPAMGRQVTDHGRVVTIQFASRVFGNTRTIRIYLPTGYGDQLDRRYRVLYMNDGASVFSARGWDAPATLDQLIAERAIPPMILVGIDNAATITGTTTPAADRANEFLPYPDPLEPDAPAPRGELYPRFLVDEVMPHVASEFRVLHDPNQVGVGGSSYGGIAALTAVLRRPGVFGALLLESTPLFLFQERLSDEAGLSQLWPHSTYVGIGTAETDDQRILRLGEAALDRFVGLVGLRSDIRVLHNIAPGATHVSASWRLRFPTALRFLYGMDQSP